MSLTVVSFTTTFDYTNNVFILTDTTDYAGQSVNTLVSSIPDVIGNFKIIDPNGNVIWNNTNFSIQSGTAQSIAAGNITLAVGASPTDDYFNGLYCFLSAGTGSPQNTRITDYTAIGTLATVSPSWVGIGGTPTYRITFGDIVPAAALTTQTSISLSNGQDGYPIAGTYTIVYTVKSAISTSAVYAVSTVSFDFDFVPPVIELSSTVDCLIPQLIATDATNYVVDGITPTITRTHTLYNPPSIGGSTVGTATDLSISNFYTPAAYQHTLSVDLSYTLADGTIVTMTLTGNQTINVTCDHKLCDIYCCVSSLWNNYMNSVTSNPTLGNIYLTKLTQVTSIMTLISQAYECSASGSTIDEYVNQILRIADCAPGCGCSSSTPVPVTGLGGNGTTIVVSAGNGITVTSATVGGTTTYTVSINQSILNSINSIQAVTVVGAVSNTVVESPTGTWTVTGADMAVSADTQLPTTTSIAVTPTTVGGIDTLYTFNYIGRDYKLLKSYAPTTPGTTTGTTEEIIAAASYTMPDGVATTAGDKIRVAAEFYTTDTSATTNSTVRLKAGGISGTVIGAWYIQYNYTSGAHKYYTNLAVRLEVELTRITATTVRAVLWVKPLTAALVYQVNASAIVADTVITIPSMDLGQPDIDFVATIEETAAGAAGRTELRLHTVEFIPEV